MTMNVTERILFFYQMNQRDLPWRKIQNPYYTLVSEIMLQQTRVDTVIPYFLRFIDRLPSIEDLAKVSEDELNKLWEGLGYYRRARNLQKAAIQIVEMYHGVIPSTYEELIHLSGIGPYTAKAILSIAFGKPYVAIDGNVLRVFTRYFGIFDDIALEKTKKDIEKKILKIYPENDSENFMQALMEIGALICLPNQTPKCNECPLKEDCYALKNKQTDSLPNKTKKEKQKVYPKTVLIIHYENDYYIHKRNNDGLLSSLYQLENVDGHLTINEAQEYMNFLGFGDYVINPNKNVKHVFTHVIWDMISYDVSLSTRDERLVPIDTIIKEYSIPTAFSKFF